MKKILVIPNTLKDADLTVTIDVLKKLREFGLIPLISNDFLAKIGDLAEYFVSYPSDADAIIVIGGDGSVIEASKVAIGLGIPLLGVNLGNLGYLSEVETDQLDILKKLKDDEYLIAEKMLLEVEIFMMPSSRYASRQL